MRRYGAGEGTAAARLCRRGVLEGWGTAGRDTGEARLSGNLARVRVQQTLSLGWDAGFSPVKGMFPSREEGEARVSLRGWTRVGGIHR